MKIPKEIKKAIIDCAKYNAKAYPLQKIIREWLVANNLNHDGVIDQLIDRVEYSGCDPKGFINFVENENEDFGNDRGY